MFPGQTGLVEVLGGGPAAVTQTLDNTKGHRKHTDHWADSKASRKGLTHTHTNTDTHALRVHTRTNTCT